MIARTAAGTDTRAALRAAISSFDPAVPVGETRLIREAMAQTLGETQAVGRLITAFAVLTLLLSLVGLYGLVSWVVTQRNRELGIRTALGAKPTDLIRIVVGRTMMVTAMGLALGLLGAVIVGRGLASLLYDVGPIDPLVLIGAGFLMGVASLCAAWLPARHASRADAMATLRD